MTILIKKTFSWLAGPGGFCLASLYPGRLFPLPVLSVTAGASLPELNDLGDTLSLKRMPAVEDAKGAIPANRASILPGKRWAKSPDKLTTAAALQLALMEARTSQEGGDFSEQNSSCPCFFAGDKLWKILSATTCADLWKSQKRRGMNDPSVIS